MNKSVTGDYKFYMPAQKMYKKCGLKIKGKRKVIYLI